MTLTQKDDRFDYPARRFQTCGWLEGRTVLVVGRRPITASACFDEELPRQGKPSHRSPAFGDAWDDEDTPEWTDDQLDRAKLAVGGAVVRPASGTPTRAGQPPLGAASKRQVTLRLDPDVLDRFREGEPGWQGRINEALRNAVGL